MTSSRPRIEPADFIGNLSAPRGAAADAGVGKADRDVEPAVSKDSRAAGLLIVNADDWGRNYETTVAILNCVLRGTVSSVSAMVFMEDSERAATVALEQGVDAGLHLNFTTSFSAPGCPAQLLKHQREVAKYLSRSRFAHAMFHPGLMRSFEYVVRMQLDEFCRLYQGPPDRVDGHHHMHLCANVLLGGLLPPGTLVRRNFSFMEGEKSYANILYRKSIDSLLKRKHRMVDYFFKLPPMKPLPRLQRIFGLAHRNVVELETHPSDPEEYKFLAEGAILGVTGDLSIAPRFVVPYHTCLERRGRS
jgi:predicted glycoside hydrolase/deacetylase ChbG (UPF0249 family)